MSSPPGIGYPDWTPMQQVAGVVNPLDIGSVSSGSVIIGSAYCGGNASVQFMVQITGATPWVLTVWFSDSPTDLSNAFGFARYEGINNCEVVDNLPCLAPYVIFQLTNQAATPQVFYNGFFYLNQSSTPGTNILREEGLAIGTYGHSLAASQLLVLSSVFLSPGEHQLFMQAESTGGVLMNCFFSIDGVNYLLASVETPAGAFAQISQTIIVPNAQVSCSFTNSAGGAGSAYATLCRAL